MWTQNIYIVQHMSLADTAHPHVAVSGSEIMIQEIMSGPNVKYLSERLDRVRSLDSGQCFAVEDPQEFEKLCLSDVFLIMLLCEVPHRHTHHDQAPFRLPPGPKCPLLHSCVVLTE